MADPRPPRAAPAPQEPTDKGLVAIIARLEADLTAVRAQLEQPPSDRFLLNEYGRKCWHLGRESADAELIILRNQQWEGRALQAEAALTALRADLTALADKWEHDTSSVYYQSFGRELRARLALPAQVK